MFGAIGAQADGPVRARGRALLSVVPNPEETPWDVVRYEVNAVFSSESSAFAGGVVFRFELPDVQLHRLGVAVIDVDLPELLAAGRLPLSDPRTAIRYHELAPGAEVTFEGLLRSGEIELLGHVPTSQGLALHLAFDAELFDAQTGETRLLLDAEARTLSAAASWTQEVGWVSDEPADVVAVTGYYDSTDCSGDPLWDGSGDDSIWYTVGWDDPVYDDPDDSGGGGSTSDDDYDYETGNNNDDSSWDTTYDDGSYDPSTGCGGDDWDDDSEGLDCGGDDPGSSGGKYGGSGGSDCGGGDDVDGEGLDCADDAFAASSVHAGPRPPKPRARHRWRGWNMAPLLAAVLWWLYLKRRRTAEKRAADRWTR